MSDTRIKLAALRKASEGPDPYAEADADHTPVRTVPGEDGFECGRCGLAITADARRHGHIADGK